jgi:hypothetical protein
VRLCQAYARACASGRKPTPPSLAALFLLGLASGRVAFLSRLSSAQTTLPLSLSRFECE